MFAELHEILQWTGLLETSATTATSQLVKMSNTSTELSYVGEMEDSACTIYLNSSGVNVQILCCQFMMIRNQKKLQNQRDNIQLKPTDEAGDVQQHYNHHSTSEPINLLLKYNN